MNPLTQTRNIMKMNDRELELGVAGTKNSWHSEYKDSAWVFLGGLPFELTEGDVICMFSQYGEVVHINLIRDHGTGKSKGFGFLCYEDQRSTILAVDNLNGFKILNRMIRVDHVHQYKLPKDLEKLDQDKKALFMSGVAPKPISASESSSEEEEELLDLQKEDKKAKKKKKKEKKKHKKKKKKKDKDGSSSDDEIDRGKKDHDRDTDRNKKERDRHSNGDSHRQRSPPRKIMKNGDRKRSRSPYRRDKSGERRNNDRSRSRSRDKRRRDRS